MPAMPELDGEEFFELRTLLRHTIAADPFPLSPRVKRLRAILDKLDPAASPAAATPGTEAGRRAERYCA